MTRCPTGFLSDGNVNASLLVPGDEVFDQKVEWRVMFDDVDVKVCAERLIVME